MPRMARLDAPGSLTHVMARGIDGRVIFSDDDDRQEFIRRLSASLSICGFKCLAWCLMDNHYHFMLRTNEKPLSALMRRLNGGYARWFNHKNSRRGYLFQDRFKSVLCQDQEYAKQLIRYIHLNPLRDGMVRSVAQLGSWQWCGHGYLLGNPDSLGKGFQDRWEALRRFGQTPRNAVSAYLSYFADGVDAQHIEKSGDLPSEGETEIAGSHKGWPAVVGDPEFAREAMASHRTSTWRKHRQTDYRGTLTKIARQICAEFSVSEDDLLRRGWNNARATARSAFCYRAHFEELLPLSAIADFMGITMSPVLLLARKGKSSLSNAVNNQIK